MNYKPPKLGINGSQEFCFPEFKPSQLLTANFNTFGLSKTKVQ